MDSTGDKREMVGSAKTALQQKKQRITSCVYAIDAGVAGGKFEVLLHS